MQEIYIHIEFKNGINKHHFGLFKKGIHYQYNVISPSCSRQ